MSHTVSDYFNDVRKFLDSLEEAVIRAKRTGIKEDIKQSRMIKNILKLQLRLLDVYLGANRMGSL